MDIYNKPQQLLPDSKKNEQWCKDNIDYRIAISTLYDREKEIDRECYRRFYGERNYKDFEYLSKEFGIQYPAKFKFIPVVKPILDTLIGEELNRVRNYYVRAIDEKSILEKKFK